MISYDDLALRQGRLKVNPKEGLAEEATSRMKYGRMKFARVSMNYTRNILILALASSLQELASCLP